MLPKSMLNALSYFDAHFGIASAFRKVSGVLTDLVEVYVDNDNCCVGH